MHASQNHDIDGALRMAMRSLVDEPKRSFQKSKIDPLHESRVPEMKF